MIAPLSHVGSIDQGGREDLITANGQCVHQGVSVEE